MMMSFVVSHILGSTIFCLVMVALACCLRRDASARHTALLIGIAKFAIPSALLTSAGAQIAFAWPAAPWLSSVVNRVSGMIAELEGILPPSPVGTGTRITAILLSVWLLGSALMAVRWRNRLESSRCRPTDPQKWEDAALLRARALLPVRLPVQLRISGSSEEPALRGIWRPTITIPTGLSQSLSASEFQAVLLHELAHARRLDNLWAMLVHSLVIAFWFHPLVWLVERRLNVERERACDAIVVACGAKPDVYAAGILKVCKFHLFGAVAGVSAMTASDLKVRLELILRPMNVRGPFSYAPQLVISLLTVLMTVVPVAGGYCSQCASNGQPPVSSERQTQR